MSTSQNGWPAFTGWGQAGSCTAIVPGTNVKIQGGLRAGDVCTVLLDFAGWFNREIEPVRDGWCWGIDIRSIRGSSTTSNHQSGTAMDLNAPAHPLGSSPYDNYTSAQIAKIRAKLIGYVGVIRWGGDYSGRKDPMHFEINASAAAVAAVARNIQPAGPTPAPVNPAPAPAPPEPAPSKMPPAPPFPLARGQYFGPKSGPANSISGYYSHRDDLRVWQRQINTRGWTGTHRLAVDGLYGPSTALAALVLQQHMHLTTDQLIGPATWAAAWKELP